MLKRPIATFIAVLGLATAAYAEPRIGHPAPDFTATDALSGHTVHLSDFKGKRVVLEWNNPECPFVKKFYGSNTMQTLQADAVKDGVVWIAINSSAKGKEGYLASPAEAKAFVAASHAQPAYYIRDEQGMIGKLYEAKTTPHMFVIDTKGTLAYMGAIDDTPTANAEDIATAKNYVMRALQALHAGEPVEVASTRPYGCFVKYSE